MKNKNSIYLPNMQNFGILASFRPLFEIKYWNFLWPIKNSLQWSIWKKNCIKIEWKI